MILLLCWRCWACIGRTGHVTSRWEIALPHIAVIAVLLRQCLRKELGAGVRRRLRARLSSADRNGSSDSVLLAVVHRRNSPRLLRFAQVCVQRNFARSACTTARIRRRCIDAPLDVLPADRDLLIDMNAPFCLHLGFDGWQAIEDHPSSPLPFGRHGVRLTRGELAGKGVLDFTMYFMDEARWHGIDYHVRLASEPHDDGLVKLVYRCAFFGWGMSAPGTFETFRDVRLSAAAGARSRSVAPQAHRGRSTCGFHLTDASCG